MIKDEDIERAEAEIELEKSIQRCRVMLRSGRQKNCPHDKGFALEQMVEASNSGGYYAVLKCPDCGKTKSLEMAVYNRIISHKQ